MNAPPRPRLSRPALDSRPSTLDAKARGFTLVELLVVIVIIALLIGLITPAIFAAITRARVAEVRAEISQLEEAIGSFKAEYGGIEPPSSIRLYEQKQSDGGWVDSRGKAFIRRIWPQFNFELDRDLNGQNGIENDPDGDGTEGFVLTGEECLVFFLGGVTNSGQLVGFSKNPANPFDPTAGNRAGPFFEFDHGRLRTGTSYSVYLDPWPSQASPYVYFSSYDGRGYQDTDSGLTNHYTLPGGTTDYKPNSYQIISAGGDYAHGDGGVYDPDDETTVNENERDNITNFSSGKLVP